MAGMEVEPGDERYSLGSNINEHGEIYKTRRSRRIKRRLGRWIGEGRSPDEDLDGRPYSFVSDCCALSIDLQNEIITEYYAPSRHNFHLFFPELDSLVVDPLGYLRAVRGIIRAREAGGATFSDGLLLDLQQEGLLHPSMVTTVVAVRSSLSASPTVLPRETLSKLGAACNRSLALDSISQELDAFVLRGGRIALLAPNLSALVGPSVAAKLIGAAGGLPELSALPVPDIPLLGPACCRKDPRRDHVQLPPLHPVFDYPRHEQLLQLQQLPDHITRPYVAQADLLRSAPQPRLLAKACHLLAERIRLAATLDLDRADPTGESGRAMVEETRAAIGKWNDEDSALLMKLRTLPTIARPKKNKLAVSHAYSRLFKLNPNTEKPRHAATRSKMDNNRAELVLSSLKEFGLTPTAASSASNLRAH